MEKGERINVPTFLKWAGGKKKLLVQFKRYFPTNIKTYVEPFLGGGAVLFYFLKYKEPEKVYAYDVNKELINVYIQVRANPKKLINFLEKYQNEHNKSKNPKIYYYERREEYNSKLKDKTKKAALFIYLNKTCYNGLYRVNLINQFNVPFGKYKKIKIFCEKDILDASKLLQDVTLKALGFDEIKFPKNSFVYFDPPYWSESNGFTNYNKIEFSKSDQMKLQRLFIRLDNKGCKLFLSNSNTDYIKLLYNKFDFNEVDTRWMINCNGEDRLKLKELLINN